MSEVNVMIALDNGERTKCLVNGPDGRIVLRNSRPAIIKDYIGTDAPAVTDDEDAGYAVGSQWIDTDAAGGSRVFLCTDATAGAAVWDALG